MKYCIDCSKNNIKKTATYGDINDESPKYCSGCSINKNKDCKIVNFKHGYCMFIINDGGKLLSERMCGKNANYNYINCTVKKGIRCNEHYEKSMICINGHLCKDCKIKQASFIDKGSGKKTATYCRECTIKYTNKEFIDVVHKICKECKIKSATFGLKDSGLKEYCKECSDKLNLEIEDLHHKKCITCNINSAQYNLEGEKPLYCNDCKSEDMIYIYKRKCKKCNITTPTFNFKDYKTPIYCSNCSEEGMINVVNERCIECKINRPSFNYYGETKPLYCKSCSDEIAPNEMFNIYKDYCNFEDCNEYAWYNFEGETKGKYCKEHIEKGMINIIGNLCIEKGCYTISSYNYPNEIKRLYCSIHAKKGMEDVAHKKCIVCNKNRAIFNNYGEVNGLYCIEHKTDLMINFNHKLCFTYLCGKRSIEKYDNYCMTCYIRINPDKPVSRNYKTKESNVVQYLLNKFKDYTWIVDKPISDGCSLKRPDLLLDLGYQVINIEIDENQHKSYEEICENKRLMTISQDIQHRNLILIRFNPDGYTIDNSKKVESCWTNSNKGICTIKKTYEKQWEKRLLLLENTVNYWLNPENISDKMIHIINLYFDE
jgi:hypothetical protein